MDLLPFEIMLKISVVFQGSDCVIDTGSLPVEIQKGITDCLHLLISVFLNQGNSYYGNPTKEISAQC